MKEQDRQDYSNYRMNPTPTLTTLTQSDHDIIRTFLSSVPAGFPLSPGAALAELTGFAPLSPVLAGLGVAAPHTYHASPSRFDPGSPGRFPPYSEPSISYSLKSRNLNSPLRISNLDSPHRLSQGLSSPQRSNTDIGIVLHIFSWST